MAFSANEKWEPCSERDRHVGVTGDGDDRLPELPGRGPGAGASARSCLLWGCGGWAHRNEISCTDPAHREPQPARHGCPWRPCDRTTRRLRKLARRVTRPAGGTSARQADPRLRSAGNRPLRPPRSGQPLSTCRVRTRPLWSEVSGALRRLWPPLTQCQPHTLTP